MIYDFDTPVKRSAAAYIEQEFSGVKPLSSKAAYLLWLDCTGFIGCAEEAADFLRRLKTGLAVYEAWAAHQC